MSKLMIVCGISFAGNSTLGEAIAKRFGYVQVDVDETKAHHYKKYLSNELDLALCVQFIPYS